MRSEADSAWIEGLSPWPEEFGLERMRRLLAALGEPQFRFPSIHVVGTNGKSTVTRMTAALLRAAGLRVGAYTSPHVSGWSERIQIDGADCNFRRAVGRVRPAAEALSATQFEALTAAGLAAFAAAEVDVAVVEAGLGGRLDATNVLRSQVQVLTNVALDHTDVLGETREAIAAEKLAVVQPGSTVVLGEVEWEGLARANGAGAVRLVPQDNLAVALAATEAFLGRPVGPSPAESAAPPGRLERRGDAPLELWAGAHNPASLAYLLPRLPRARYVVVASILADKDAEAMLAGLAAVGDRLVATSSSNNRALAADELAARAARFFDRVEAVTEPDAALRRGRELAGERGAVLVTGSLYLLADLYAAEKTYHASTS